MTELRTQRLLLRPWHDSDLGAFAALNDDPAVMEHFPHHLTREGSDEMAGRIRAFLDENGWGLWAVEVAESGEFIGFTGLSVPRFDAPFMPAVEVGWRLGRSAWGKGFATEAARASLDHAFRVLGLEEVISMTIPANTRSQAVMRRLGMTRDEGADFDHPLVPEGSHARRHVLYRVARADWDGGR